MRVVIATSFPEDPDAPAGGVEAVSVCLVRALSAFNDLEIHVLTTGRARTDARTEQWGATVVHRLPWAGGSTLRHAIGPGRQQMQKYLGKIKPDVVHAHDSYGMMVKGLAVPRVFTVHGFIYADTRLSGGKLARLRSCAWRRFETAAWADQPHIISISPYVRERLRGIAAGVIHDIDNPVPEAFFDIKREERKGTIFSAAVVTRRKNPLALVDAIAELVADGVDCHLRLAGPTPDECYVRKVRERILQRGLGKHVTLLGSLSTRQISRELSQATVFALASLEENSPMGIEEAMAAGLPVVTSNRCGMPYMVRDGESGFLVNPNDSHDIARRLKSLLEDDKLRRVMRSKAKEIASDRFHPAKVAIRTRDVYFRAVEDFE